MEENISAFNHKGGEYDNGFVRCRICDVILAHINYDACKNIYLRIVCKCGADGRFVLGNMPDGINDKMRSASLIDGKIICPRCGQTLFSICCGTDVYSFAVECTCGNKCNSYVKKCKDFKRF